MIFGVGKGSFRGLKFIYTYKDCSTKIESNKPLCIWEMGFQ